MMTPVTERNRLSDSSLLGYLFALILLYILPASATDRITEEHEKQEIHPSLQKGQGTSLAVILPSTLTFSAASDDPLDTEIWGITRRQVDYLFETSQDLVCLATERKFIKVNSAWSQVLGWSEEELVGLDEYHTIIHPDDRIMTGTAVAAMINHRVALFGFENRYRCKDGSYRWIHWKALTKARQDEEDYIFCIARDITAQKEAEKKVHDLLEELSLKNKQLLALDDINMAYLEEMPERNHQEIGSTQYATREISAFCRIAHNFARLANSEYGFIKEYFTAEGANSILLDDEALLQELMLVDKEGHRYFSKEYPTMLDWSKIRSFIAAIIKTQSPVIINDISTQQPSQESPYSIALKNFLGVPLILRDKLVGVLCLLNHSGDYTTEFIQKLDGVPKRAAKILEEIRLQRQLKQIEVERAARERAEQNAKVKSDLLAQVSHDLRTPLTGLLGMLDIIDVENFKDEDKDYLEAAKESGRCLITLLNDLLDVTKIEAGQLRLEKIPLNPIKIAQEVAKVLTPEADKKEITIELTTDPKIPDELVGDPTRLRQILFNLVGNAIKFIPKEKQKGVVKIKLKGKALPLKEEDRNSNAQPKQFILQVTVKDNGIGMSPQQVQKLFAAYIQAEDSTQRLYGGTGLGLYISKKLCELMGGNITVESELGKGSAFHFDVCLENINKQEESEEEQRQYNVRKRRLSQLPPLNILVAEDNAMNQKLLYVALTKVGCQVTLVSTGAEAVKTVQSQQFDLIIMDGQMPVMDGLEATRQIRQLHSKDTLPIIGLTAHAGNEDRERFLESGMNAFLTKPLDLQDLKAEILKYAENRQKS